MVGTQVCQLCMVTINDDTYQDAYYAYLQIFDANTKKERKMLLERIILDPHISVLFYKNCNPSDVEKEIAFDSISNDIDSTLLFLKECEPNGKHREEAIKIVLCDDDYAKKTACLCNLNSEELERIHKKYNSKWVTTDSAEYFNYCMIFKNCLLEDEKEFLIDIVLDEQDLVMAKIVMNSDLELNEKLQDKLEGLFVLKKLEEV